MPVLRAPAVIPSRPRASAAQATLLAATAILIASAPGDAQQTERRTLQDDRIAIYNLAGTITAEPTSGSQVVVEIARGGRDGADLRIVETERDRNRVLAIAYPHDRIVHPSLRRGSNTTLNVRSDGTFGGDSRGSRRVRISGGGDGAEAFADLRVQVPRGQTISLHLAAGEVRVTNVEGNVMVDVHMAGVTTENTSGMLMVDAGSGRTLVRNARGDLALDLGSGPITMEGVRATRIMIDAGSGAITGTDVTARELHLDTGSGRVSLARTSAEQVHLDTGSGSVDLELSATLRSLFIDSGSGSITLRVPRSLGASIEAETGSGGIEVGIPMQVRRMGRNRLSATIGDGTAQVRIDAGSGRIRILGS